MNSYASTAAYVLIAEPGADKTTAFDLDQRGRTTGVIRLEVEDIHPSAGE